MDYFKWWTINIRKVLRAVPSGEWVLSQASLNPVRLYFGQQQHSASQPALASSLMVSQSWRVVTPLLPVSALTLMCARRVSQGRALLHAVWSLIFSCCKAVGVYRNTTYFFFDCFTLWVSKQELTWTKVQHVRGTLFKDIVIGEWGQNSIWNQLRWNKALGVRGRSWAKGK